ncbi:MAG: GIN domain-containing protein [Mucilaginibacter sp.]
MKTKVLTFAAIAAIVLGIGTTSYAAGKNDSAATTTEVSTVLTDISKISKIEVRGNVELYVSNDAKDEVKVYNHYYGQSALVQNQNGVLRISSYSNKKLVVWVKATDLRSINVYDNAEVRSFGKLSSIDLNVNLHNEASAQLNLDAYSANVTVTDRAKADLSGTASEFTLNHGIATSVNKYDLQADHYTEVSHAPMTEGLADL